MNQTGRLFALLNKTKLTREQRISFYRWMIGRDTINSTDDLTAIELAELVDQLWKWEKAGTLTQHVTNAVEQEPQP